MPAGHDPTAARLQEELVVKAKSNDGGSPASGLANDLCSILTPGEVISPGVLSRVKQWNRFAGININGMRLNAFVPVA